MQEADRGMTDSQANAGKKSGKLSRISYVSGSAKSPTRRTIGDQI